MGGQVGVHEVMAPTQYGTIPIITEVGKLNHKDRNSGHVSKI